MWIQKLLPIIFLSVPALSMVININEKATASKWGIASDVDEIFPSTCKENDICCWYIHFNGKPITQIFKSLCQCDTKSKCVRTQEDPSVSTAYIYRCRQNSSGYYFIPEGYHSPPLISPFSIDNYEL